MVNLDRLLRNHTYDPNRIRVYFSFLDELNLMRIYVTSYRLVTYEAFT